MNCGQNGNNRTAKLLNGKEQKGKNYRTAETAEQ
jgi:hypothetical protein